MTEDLTIKILCSCRWSRCQARWNQLVHRSNGSRTNLSKNTQRRI